MVGESVDTFKFRKANQAVTLASRSSVKITSKSVTVDPQLLFQRLITVRDHFDGVQSLFQYDLCSHPPALFEASTLPLQPTKSVLADVLWKDVQEEQPKPNGEVQYVLDGGALLHRIPWPRRSTFENVSQLYVNYVTQKYGTATVVFDGYSDYQTTKDATHSRRVGACTGVTVHFTGGMTIQSNKEEFLSN